MGRRGSRPEAHVWQPNPDVEDSALVWRVVGPTVPRRRSSLFSFGAPGTGDRLFTGPAAESLADSQVASVRQGRGTTAKTAAYELAALELTDRLSGPERTRLREAGVLPDWFDVELKARAREIEKRRRRSG